MRMHRERKMMEDQSEPRTVFLAEFVKNGRHGAARGALKVAKFLDRHRCIRFAANMNAASYRGRRARCRSCCRNLLRPVKGVAGTECNQRNRDHDEKRQEPFHELKSPK